MSPLPRIRTYESDVAEALKKNSVSRADIALAEGARLRRAAPAAAGAAETETASHLLRISTDLPVGSGAARLPWRQIVLWGGGAVLLALVGAGIYYGFLWSRGVLNTETTTTQGSNAQTAGGLSIAAGETRAGLIQKIQKAVEDADIQLNEVRPLAVTIEGAPLTPEKLFAILSATAPASLARAFDSPLSFGAHAFRGNQLFILIPVRSYEYAFAGMLQWGNTILDDVGPLFKIQTNALALPQGTSTTAALQQPPALKDAIIKNKDARALFAQDGSIIFLYSFLDRETLLITTNDETLKTLLPKVSRGQLR